ncbi:MAG: hypothetical protein ACREB5_04630 [Sphingomonadaceae bacterium]
MMRFAPILMIAAAPLAACTPNDTTLGGAMKHNIAMQVIDPDPAYQGDLMEGGSGDHAGKAAERYRQGQVKQPTSIRSTSSVRGGGSGPN